MATKPKKIKLDDEARLNKLLFANTSDLIEKFSSTHDEEEEESLISSTKENAVWHDDDDDINVGSALELQGRNLPNAGVNDYKGQYSDLVKHKYKLLVGTPEWAKIKTDFNEDNNDILQSVGFISKSSGTSLPKGNLDYKKLTYLNTDTGKEGPIINAIEFHPTSSVALVAGASGVVSLVTVDGLKNKKLHSVAFKKFPIHCARFSRTGSEAILGSLFPHFYKYDLLNAKAMLIKLPEGITKMRMFELSNCGKFIAIGGRFGEIHLLCAKSTELIQTLKQQANVTAIAFSHDSTKLYGHSADGRVTVWDLSTRRVFHKWTDDGCISGSSLAISPSGQYFATGSAQGVVNLYDSKDVLLSEEPTPKKIFLNLTTKITDLKFNPTSEILAFLSSYKPNAIRFAHIPSFEVFLNFPGVNPNLSHCSAINFSPHSGYMSFGNNKKLAYLYRLNYYKNY